MGGNMFDDTSSVTLDRLNSSWDAIVSKIKGWGGLDVTMLGSTGKKQLMSDIDVGVVFDAGRDVLFRNASTALGHGNAKRGGNRTVHAKIYVCDVPCQLDVIVGNTSYLKWSMFGTSDISDHDHFSPVKGFARNLFLNAVTRESAHVVFPQERVQERRTRHTVDFSVGLHKVEQERVSGPRPWVVKEREFISDDPATIVQTIFGHPVPVHETLTLEGVVRQVKSSDLLVDVLDNIFETYIDEVAAILVKRPYILGPDANSSLKYIRETCRR